MGSMKTGPILPSQSEAAIARELAARIATRLHEGATIKISVDETADGVALPLIAARLMLELLDELARGNAVSLSAIGAELTTQEAADLLNISRPTLIQSLDDGKIPYRRIGTHRRIPLANLLTFKAGLYAERKATLDEMSSLHQDMGLE